MIRILHIVGKMDRGGAETMIMNLFRHMDDEIRFDFVTFTNDKGDYDNEIIALGGKIIPIIGSNLIERNFKLLRFIWKNKDYKIIHSHNLLSTGLHLLVAKIGGIKNRIAHSHSTNYRKGFGSIIYKKISTYLINRFSTHAFACGKDAGQFLFPNRSDVKIVPNSVDTRKLSALSHYKQNDEYHFDRVIRLIQIGRLEKVKNHFFSIKLADYLRNNNHKFSLLIVGKGSRENEIREEIARHNLQDHVKMLGLREDIAELMAGSDFMLMPSLHEGFPVVLVESQSTGLKTLVSDTVSKEVDLGFNLIKFFSIDSDPSIWAEGIAKWNTEKISSVEERMAALDKAGFNVVQNAIEMTGFYKSLRNV